MAESFRNPVNGHVETVDNSASACVFFFGGLYLLFKGLWSHFGIWLVVLVVCSTSQLPPVIIFAGLILAIIYAFKIQSILANRYLHRGWVKVDFGKAPPSPGAISNNFMNPPAPKPVDAENKICPFCAETIRAAAIKCKHCGSELLAEPVQTLVQQANTGHIDKSVASAQKSQPTYLE